MNVTIAYRKNGVLGNVQSRPGHLKRCKSEVIIYVENNEPYNKQQHVHSLLLAMTHYNCLEMKMRQPWDDGIVEKWTQYVDLQRENVDQRTISKVELQQPTIFSVLQKWQSSVVESSCNTGRVGSSFNQQREQCRQNQFPP
jgi:hypothetical protein